MYLKVIFVTITILICFSKESISASNKSPMPRTEVRILHKKFNSTKRPKAPSMQHIDCFYENGDFTIQFNIPEGNCQMTVTDLTSGLAFMYSC